MRRSEGRGLPRELTGPSALVGSPRPPRAGKEAEPPNSFISSRTFPNRWDKIAIKKKRGIPRQEDIMSYGQGEKIKAEGYLCSVGRREIKSEIPIKSIIYFSGNNKIRDGPKR